MIIRFLGVNMTRAPWVYKPLLACAKKIYGWRQKSQQRSTLYLKNLSKPVEVYTDTWGVPHLYAQNHQDLFMAQGYITACDRLFQMDYNRMGASGRLSEMLGRRSIPWKHFSVHFKERDTVDVDVFLRSFGLKKAAEDSLHAHTWMAREIIESYAMGVNACIAENKRTLEHRILQWTPLAWAEADTLLMLKAMAFELNFSWKAILLGDMLQKAQVPESIARTLWPHFPHDGTCIVDGREWYGISEEWIYTREAASAAIGLGNASAVGSNCFAVASTHTSNNQALLANDTHLRMTAPSPWYEIGLHGGGFDMQGFSLAGVPGIGIGRTPHLAWGLTAALVQDLDLFVEKIHPEKPTQYLAHDGWRTFEKHQETVVIRNEQPLEKTFHKTYHGPLLESAAPASNPSHALSIAWTGHGAGRELDALLQLWQSKNLEDCREGLQHHRCPPFNITVATATGRVGYFFAGEIPLRKHNTPLRPLEGWTGAWDWQGAVPREHHPYITDPSCGFVVTANNRIVSHDYPYFLGNLFEPPGRYDRITSLLARKGDTVSLQDALDIQTDAVSHFGIHARAALWRVAGQASVLTHNDAFLNQVTEAWNAWDGRTHVESTGACIGLTVPFFVAKKLLNTLAGEHAAWAFLEMASFTCQPILEMPLLQDTLKQHGIDLLKVVCEGFEEAVSYLKQQMGSHIAHWKWGRLHTLTASHRFAGTPLEGLFSLGPTPMPGGPDTVNRGDFNSAAGFHVHVAAAVRMVLNTRQPDESVSVLPGGQSGHRLNPCYDNQWPLFVEGSYKPMPMTHKTVKTFFKKTLLPLA